MLALARSTDSLSTPQQIEEPAPLATPCPPSNLKDILLAAPALGARRVTLLTIQLLTEIQLAQSSRRTLQEITLETVLVTRPDTPFEQATLTASESREWLPAEEQNELQAVGAVLAELLQKKLFLENSITDERGRLGGVPLARRVDAPVLRRVRRALVKIAARCQAPRDEKPYADASEAVADLIKLSRLLHRIVAKCRPAAPLFVRHRPRPSRPNWPLLPSVLLNASISSKTIPPAAC